MRNISILTMIAVVATLATVSSIIGMGMSVQEVNAAACSSHFDALTGDFRQNCSSDRSMEKAKNTNFNFHCKNC